MRHPPIAKRQISATVGCGRALWPDQHQGEMTMLSLFRTTCATDWKGRSSHSLVLVGTSANRDGILVLQNQDVKKWQAEVAEEMGNEEEPDGWELPNVRWETAQDNGLRMFASRDEGHTWSLAYHIVELS
jgi:hypothetical protein